MVLGSELGRRMLADALVAPAGAAAAVLVQTNSRDITAAGKPHGARRSGPEVSCKGAAAAATEVIGEAAKAMLKGETGKPVGKRKTDQDALTRQRH